ncbi:MAG: RrF2 family transcriptional regulator [Terriglobia bacterium]
MLFRRGAQVALQASLLLALEAQGGPRRVRDLAADLGVGATYLAKILQNLTRSGLLRGTRGPRGGLQLARSAREIRAWEVLGAVEPAGEFEKCVLGLPLCDDLHPCPFHEGWALIRAQLLAMLQTKTLWELANEARRKGVLEKRPRGERR